jgi:hypothetical protein
MSTLRQVDLPPAAFDADGTKGRPDALVVHRDIVAMDA